METALAADCPACGGAMSAGRAGVCMPCWEEVDRSGGVGGGTRRLPGRPLASITSLGGYEGRLRRIIRCMKFSDMPGLAAPLAERLAARLVDEPVGFELIVPVPLHWARRWRRGYNQAELLARAVARATGRPVACGALRRARATPSQTGRSREERVASVRGAFRAGRQSIEGVPLLLIDDVVTTGATLAECARVLNAAGARRVDAAAVARTPSRIQS